MSVSSKDITAIAAAESYERVAEAKIFTEEKRKAAEVSRRGERRMTPILVFLCGAPVCMFVSREGFVMLGCG